MIVFKIAADKIRVYIAAGSKKSHGDCANRSRAKTISVVTYSLSNLVEHIQGTAEAPGNS